MSDIYTNAKEIGTTYKSMTVKFKALLEVFSSYLKDNELGERWPSPDEIPTYEARFRVLNHQVWFRLSPIVIGDEMCGQISVSYIKNHANESEENGDVLLQNIYMNKDGSWHLTAKESFPFNRMEYAYTIDKSSEINKYISKEVINKLVEQYGIAFN